MDKKAFAGDRQANQIKPTYIFIRWKVVARKNDGIKQVAPIKNSRPVANLRIGFFS